ncbi:hypothetical protein [Rhabdothermincola salaria]|nr:hypothetical protein [Rhabdothermincola salaria]
MHEIVALEHAEPMQEAVLAGFLHRIVALEHAERMQEAVPVG